MMGSLSSNQTCLDGRFENKFGPSVSDDCRSFDFTLLFEQIFLALIPSLGFLLLAPIRVAVIAPRDTKILSTRLHVLKIIVGLVYAALQLVLLVLWSVTPGERTRVSVPAAVLSFICALFICILSSFEHAKSVRPSTIINVYLFFSVLFDAVQLRTLWKIHGLATIARVFSASFSTKFTLLILEAIEKDSFLRPDYRLTGQEALSSVYNLSVFWWLNRLLRIGFKKVIAFDDLYMLDPELQSQRLSIKAQDSWNKVNQESKHPLIRSTLAALKWHFLAPVVPRLCMIGFNYAQPFLLNRTVKFVNEPSSSDGTNVGYGLIGATAVIYIGRAVATGRYQHLIYRSITVVRGALISMIYSKTLKLKLHGSQDAPAVTLITADIAGITQTLNGVHDIWASLIEVAISLYILWVYAGIGFIAPLILALISMALNYFTVGKRMVSYREAWNEATQRRIALTSSALRDMRGLRMMGLGPRLGSLIQSQRIHELHRMKGLRFMIILMNIIGSIARLFSPPFVFMIYTVRARADGGRPLNSAQAYTILSVISLTIEPLSMVLTRIPYTMSSIACFDRIQQYLVREEQVDDRQFQTSRTSHSGSHQEQSGAEPPSNEKDIQTEQVILLKDVYLGYSDDACSIQSITSCLRSGTTTMIIGPVRAGKTSLLLGLLGELKCKKGQIKLDFESIAYCSQSAWLPNATIKQTITGTDGDLDEIDESWFRTVIHACALDDDVEQLPEGRESVIGSRGLTLSGGQRQRLALARAVYQRPRLLLLDDVFSALDAKTDSRIFERLFSAAGLFRQHGITTVLATHAVHHLPSADHIISLDPNGKVVKQGTFAELGSSESYITTTDAKRDGQPDDNARWEGDSKRGRVTASPAKKMSDESRRLGDFSVYNYYRKALTISRLLLFFALEAFSIGAYRSIQLLVEWWSAANGRRTNLYTCIAFLLAVLALVSQIGYLYIILVDMSPLASRRLHWILTSVVFAAPLTFFSDMDSGVILNRFSQDMSIIDFQLPIALLQTVHTTYEVLWSLALFLYGAYYLVAFVPLLGAVVYGIQKFYLRTSRQIRILDLELQSPLISMLTETIEGLATIRGFAWQEKSIRAFLKRLDASQRPFYLLYCIQRWLNFVMDIVVTCLAILLVSFATQFKSTTSGAAIGVALLNILTFGENVAALIQHWTSLETSIGAVARLKQLEKDIKPESLTLETAKPLEGWPRRGAVTFQNVSASYRSDSATILHDINLEIKAGEKIGLCGRTGSGKSTLIGLLFRLLPEHSGSIVIDGQDLSLLNREQVRSSIVSISQEPFLLQGSVRFNAAPHTTKFMDDADPKAPNSSKSTHLRPVQPIADEAIIAALERVALWDQIESAGGLDKPIDSVGLSHGQKQLFALARAWLRRDTSRLLILDEATSSVDTDTDALMRKTIEEEFKEHTVISIAHRLSSLIWCDRVIVLDKGRIVEVVDPRELSARDGGFWQEMWDKQN